MCLDGPDSAITVIRGMANALRMLNLQTEVIVVKLLPTIAATAALAFGATSVRAQDEAPLPAQEQTPPVQTAPPTQTAAPQPGGQWVYTTEYGWVWVPEGSTASPVGDEPYVYLYTPVHGWTWYVSPWGVGPFYAGPWLHRPWAWHYAPRVWSGHAWFAPRVYTGPRAYGGFHGGYQGGFHGGGYHGGFHGGHR
jgi:hypothetical protein